LKFKFKKCPLLGKLNETLGKIFVTVKLWSYLLSLYYFNILYKFLFE